MKVIPIKGTIISNDARWIYDWLEWEATAPKDVVLPESGEPIEVHINSGGGDVYAGSEIYTALRDREDCRYCSKRSKRDCNGRRYG